MFDSVTDLHRHLSTYCTALFKRMDHEMVPEVLLDIITEPYIPHSPQFKEEIVLYHATPQGDDRGAYLFSLAFDARIVDSYYRLDPTHSLKASSLLEAIVLELIDYINSALLSLLEKTPFSETSTSDLIRRAGKQFFAELIGLSSTQSPFGAINKISALSYEKSFSNGSITMVQHSDLEKTLSDALVIFQSAVPITNYRHARKLLELSKSDSALLSDGINLYATVPRVASDEHLTYLTIEFNSPSAWQLSYKGKKLMQVTYEEVYIPKPKISFFEFNSKFREIHTSIESKKIAHLYRIITEATKQVKGTILIISKNARSEAYRLRHQGFLIKPLKLTPPTIASITSIDGAVLVDIDGICHGIGVILDGMATEKGDPSRGARYNSVVRYVQTIAQTENFSNSFSVVVSEDGDVDIISNP